MYDPYAGFTKNVLSNGLEVHSAYWDRPWIGVSVVVHSGSREDSVELPGVAHFVEHLVSQNVPGYKFDDISRFFESVGGSKMPGETGYLSTEYGFAVPADIAIFREALTIFGSMLLQANLREDIERERKVINREFNGRYPFLEKLQWEMLLRKNLFKGHRLATWNRPLGRPEGFLSVTKEQLQRFYDDHYVPGNVSLVVLGGIETDRIIEELNKSPFGIKKVGQRTPIPSPVTEFAIPMQCSKVVKMSDYSTFQIDQAEYNAVWAFPTTFPNQARRVFDSVLCKILWEEVREKRALAYKIGTDYIDFHDIYEYRVKGVIDPKAVPDIGDIIRKCIQEVGLRRDLFERKLTSLKQRCLMTDLSGSSLVENSAEDLASNHRIISLQEVWDDLHKVTFEQMAEAVSFLSPERQFTAIVEP